jgi:hypothetical protein
MNIEQLIGRCSRLRQELLAAYGASPRNGGRIDRLADELASTEREIAVILASQRAGADEDFRDAA